MHVQVSGKHVAVGEALRERVTGEILTSIGKYFDRGGDADVVVSRDGYSFRVDCSVALASGQQLQSHGLGGDAHSAFDAALAKIETRIRRYKQKLKSHSIAATAKAAETAALYVLRPPEGGDVDDGWDAEDGHGPPAAMIIAETHAILNTMTVSMAVMQLDLTESQTIVFRTPRMAACRWYTAARMGISAGSTLSARWRSTAPAAVNRVRQEPTGAPKR